MKQTNFGTRSGCRRIAALALAVFAISPVVWAAETETFKAMLTGDQEVPPVVTDTTGKFRLEFDSLANEAEVRLVVRDGMSIIGSHLHCGVPGENGPIVVSLAHWVTPERGYDVDGKWIANATLTDASVIDHPVCGTGLAAFVAAIRAGNVYVNVHSVAHPGGVIRGHLLPAEDD